MQAKLPQSNVVSRRLRAFLSFTTQDKPLVEAFRVRFGLHHPQVELLDHAVTDSYEEDWKRECARKIGQSAMLICLVGAKTHRSKAVAWEIGHGLSLGKRIVAVNLTATGVRVPEVLVRNAIKPQQRIAEMVLTPASAPVLEREAHGHSR